MIFALNGQQYGTRNNMDFSPFFCPKKSRDFQLNHRERLTNIYVHMSFSEIGGLIVSEECQRSCGNCPQMPRIVENICLCYFDPVVERRIVKLFKTS